MLKKTEAGAKARPDDRQRSNGDSGHSDCNHDFSVQSGDFDCDLWGTDGDFQVQFHADTIHSG